MPVSAISALAGAGAAVTRDFTLPEAEAAYAVFLEGGLSAIELRSFLDLRLPNWLPQKIPSGRSDPMTVFCYKSIPPSVRLEFSRNETANVRAPVLMGVSL
jgi:hypothetical protein